MNWTHSSKGVALGVLLAITVVMAGTAAAISVTGSPPGESQVGEQVSMTITVDQPFADRPDQWTLGGETQLENASWTVTTLEQGRTIATNEYGGESFQQELDIASGTTEIEIDVEGTVPGIENYDYRNPEVEDFTVASVSSVVDGTDSVIESWSVHRYTEASQTAREAIDAAQEAVTDSGSSQAQDTLNTSISLYDQENFDESADLADQARNTAEESSDSGLPIVPIAIGVVAVVVLVGGGYYYWRSRQQPEYKLQ